MTDWQKQNFKKSGSSAPSSMHSKIGCGSSTLHSKIAQSPVRKYADGGMVQDDATGVDEAVARNAADDANRATASGEWARGENYGDGTTGDERVAAAKAPDYKAPAVEAEPEAAPKKQSFKEAFAENRKAGNATFEHNGKKYTTELASSKPAAPKASAPAPAARASSAKTFSEDVAERKANRLPGAVSRNENYGNESRRQILPKPTGGRGIIDMAGVDPVTLLPKKR